MALGVRFPDLQIKCMKVICNNVDDLHALKTLEDRLPTKLMDIMLLSYRYLMDYELLKKRVGKEKLRFYEKDMQELSRSVRDFKMNGDTFNSFPVPLATRLVVRSFKIQPEWEGSELVRYLSPDHFKLLHFTQKAMRIYSCELYCYEYRIKEMYLPTNCWGMPSFTKGRLCRKCVLVLKDISKRWIGMPLQLEGELHHKRCWGELVSCLWTEGFCNMCKSEKVAQVQPTVRTFSYCSKYRGPMPCDICVLDVTEGERAACACPRKWHPRSMCAEVRCRRCIHSQYLKDTANHIPVLFAEGNYFKDLDVVQPAQIPADKIEEAWEPRDHEPVINCNTRLFPYGRYHYRQKLHVRLLMNTYKSMSTNFFSHVDLIIRNDMRAFQLHPPYANGDNLEHYARRMIECYWKFQDRRSDTAPYFIFRKTVQGETRTGRWVRRNFRRERIEAERRIGRELPHMMRLYDVGFPLMDVFRL